MPSKKGESLKKGSEKNVLAVGQYFAQSPETRKGSAARIAREFGVNERTLRDYISRAGDDGTVKLLRSGRDSYLGDLIEQDIVDWIVSRSYNNVPVSRSEIVAAANAIKRLIDSDPSFTEEQLRQVLNDVEEVDDIPVNHRRGIKFQSFGHNWIHRFLGRHKELSPRVSQNVSRARSDISEEELVQTCGKLRQLCDTYEIDSAHRVFNMDETFVSPDARRDIVIVLRGTKDVAQRVKSCSFHTTVVACGSAAGDIVPPMFLFPGQRRPKGFGEHVVNTLDVSMTAKGWMNAETFVIFLEKFHSWLIARDVLLPVILIMDNCSSHLGLPGINFARRNNIILFCIPPNATHIIQPLDVAVFSSVKGHLNQYFRDARFKSDAFSVGKAEMINIVLEAWGNESFSKNLVSGFATTGIWPIDELRMRERIAQFDHKRKNSVSPHWLRAQLIARIEILTIPIAAPPAPKKAKKVVVTSLLVDCGIQTDGPHGDATSDASNEICVCQELFTENDMAIMCDQCGQWYHDACQGVDARLFGIDDAFICTFCDVPKLLDDDAWPVK